MRWRERKAKHGDQTRHGHFGPRRRKQSNPQNCSDCPPEDYPTDKTRCLTCPRHPRHLPASAATDVSYKPDVESISTSVRDGRCLEVWFARNVTDADREWLRAAVSRPDLLSPKKTTGSQP